MPLTRAIAAYGDCQAAFERAADSRKGYRLLFATHRQANRMQFRMNHYRSLLREESARIYDETDKRYGTSEFDPFMILLQEGADDPKTGAIEGWWVYIRRATMNAIAGEEIDDDDGTEPIVEIASAPAHPLQLEKPRANTLPDDLE